MRSQTFLEDNSAPGGTGSIRISPTRATLDYELPAPPGRYLFIPSGNVFSLDSETEDLNFPYGCPAGVKGGTSPSEQIGPGCAGPW